jgi:hypothetical protein
MGLSSDLDDVDLTMPCSNCLYALAKPGRWFRTISRFPYEKCQTTSRISYPEKVALFDRHAEAVSERGSRGGGERSCMARGYGRRDGGVVDRACKRARRTPRGPFHGKSGFFVAFTSHLTAVSQGSKAW